MTTPAFDFTPRTEPDASDRPQPNANGWGSRSTLLANVRAGIPAAFLMRAPIERFSDSLNGLVELAGLHLVLAVAWDGLLTSSPRVFNLFGLTSHGLWLLSLAGVALVLGREAGAEDRRIVRLATAMLAPLFAGWVFFASAAVLLEFFPDTRAWLLDNDLYGWPWFVLWSIAVWTRLLGPALPLPRRRIFSTLVVQGFAVGLLMQHIAGPWFWYTDRVAPPRPKASAPAIDVERTLYAQSSRVADVLAELEPGRPGVPDLYLVSVGADARQDVFRKEATYVRDLFDRRFGTRGRSILLLNHAETHATVPIASVSNLAHVLDGLTDVMDPAEDVIVVYVTSHGSRDHEVRVRFPRFPLNHLDPETLSGLLEENGYAWPAVIISACYSGGFIGPLAHDQSLVITSAAPDRTSFGCSDDADLTYFARAYFQHQLEGSTDLVGAFADAASLVEKWEREEEFKASMPQMHAGAAMREKLATLLTANEARTQARLAGTTP